MQRKEKVIGLALAVMLITTGLGLFMQQTEILNLKEQIGAGDGSEKPDIGAMITFTVR